MTLYPEYGSIGSNSGFKKGSSVLKATHKPNVINVNRMKSSLFCTIPNTKAPLSTSIHLCLGIDLLLTVKGCFHLMSFGDFLPVQQMSVITVNTRWWIFGDLQHQNIVITILPKSHSPAQYINGVCFKLIIFSLW